MNRNELERMLSQVDEQYVAEILDAEEMTAEEIPVITKKPQFGKYAAIAAAVCLCVAGGCWMLARQGGVQTVPDSPDSGVSVGQSADTSIEEHIDYDLIWEQLPAEQMCIDYTWDAGGESVKVTNPTLPFAADAYSIREAHFNLDANGTPENMYLIVHGGGGDNTIQITLHEKGHLFPSNFHVDFSADAGREKPAIHIYETTNSYGEDTAKQFFELYFIWNGVGFSMECDGISLQEAEQIAASFLNQTCAGLFAENDPGRYFALEQPLVASADFTMESTGGTHELDESCAFFTASPFGPTHFSGRYYLREDGSTANMQLTYSNQEKTQTVDVTISGTGTMYAHGQLDSAQGADRNGTMLYGCHTINGAVVTFHTNGWDCQITANGMTDDEVLLFCDDIIEILGTDFAETAMIEPEGYFFRDVSEITAHYTDYVWHGLQEVHIEKSVLNIPLMQSSARFIVTSDGMAQFGILEYEKDGFASSGFARIYFSNHGDMGLDFPIRGPEDGRMFNGVMVYGFSDAANPDRKELCFITKEGLGCCITSHRLSEEQVLEIAKVIMDKKISLQLLLEKTPIRVEPPTDHIEDAASYFGCTESVGFDAVTYDKAFKQLQLTQPELLFPSIAAEEKTDWICDNSYDMDTGNPVLMNVFMEDAFIVIGESERYYPGGVITEEPGKERHGVELYGHRGEYLLLAFIKDGWSYYICASPERYSEEWVLTLADDLILEGYTPESLHAEFGDYLTSEY